MAIEADGLRKSFGKVHALRGMDLAVPPGSVWTAALARLS